MTNGYTFFVLADGTAAVSSEGETVASLGPGDLFGEQLEAAHPEIASRLGEAMAARVAG